MFGPVFPERPDPVRWVTRTGDDLLYWFPWYGDSAGRVGGSEWEHSRLTLYRDDVKLCETLDFEVGECNAPAADGRFRLELAVDQGAPVALSTRTTTTWTFRSRHVDGDTPWPCRCRPCDLPRRSTTHNSAPSGKPYQGAGHGAKAARTAAGQGQRASGVEVSYDYGATWQAAPEGRTATGGVAIGATPSGRRVRLAAGQGHRQRRQHRRADDTPRVPTRGLTHTGESPAANGSSVAAGAAGSNNAPADPVRAWGSSRSPVPCAPAGSTPAWFFSLNRLLGNRTQWRRILVSVSRVCGTGWRTAC